MHSIKFLSKLTFGILLFCIPLYSCAKTGAENGNVNHLVLQPKDSTTAVVDFMHDLRNFVSTTTKEAHVSKVYWKKNKELWQALQRRKENLKPYFSKVDLAEIERLEAQYNRLFRRYSGKS